nr:GMC oxidoreductase [Cryobacterium sp. Hz9]
MNSRSTAIHLCDNARFGPADDPGAVINQYGHVHGIDGLRVPDTSILPTTLVRGPIVTAVLTGEIVADFIHRGFGGVSPTAFTQMIIARKTTPPRRTVDPSRALRRTAPTINAPGRPLSRPGAFLHLGISRACADASALDPNERPEPKRRGNDEPNRIRGGTSLKKCAETAVHRTAGYEGGYSAMAALVDGALERELARPAVEFNNGEPFPRNVGGFRQGRPLGS